MKARVDDELNRLGTEFSNLSNNLIGQLSCARIDHQGALRTNLDSDVGAISCQHVDIPSNVKHMDVSVVRSRIGRAAGLLRSGRNHFGFRRIFGGGGGVFYGSKKLGVQRLTAAK